MGKIIFYEDKDFSGSHFECSKDCPDLLSNLSRCNSIRVESSCFMIYEKPNYTGNQYYLRRGEYPNFHHWSGVNDLVGSCRHIHTESGSFNMRLFERIEFGGQMIDLIDDCPSVMDRFNIHNIFSCNVTNGNWLFYEHPHYHGKMYLIRPGEYKRFNASGSCSDKPTGWQLALLEQIQGPENREPMAHHLPAEARQSQGALAPPSSHQD
ncbi:hypothetical protein CRENBAI_002964 [Crenichthys baileyi]|uniref:Beta/gamma crystallin 'Greek key' domain-containing protein n=1 Tax=Crenichthys baileyi TaxID=28760 RepID=A0AAV9R1K2_9TELE